MTRWDLLRDILKSHDIRDAIGKAWPLFLFLLFNTDRSNKFHTNYAELSKTLEESPNTIKYWRECLVERKVVQVFKGKCSMSFVFLPPYDSIITCEQDDLSVIRMKADPATKRVLDQMDSFNNMSLLPVIAEISAKLENLEKKLK